MVAAGEVDAGDLQVASINVALVKRNASVACYLLVGAATLAVIALL